MQCLFIDMKSYKVPSSIYVCLLVFQVVTKNTTNGSEVVFDKSNQSLTQIILYESKNLTTYKFSYNKISKIQIQSKEISKYNSSNIFESVKILLLDNNKITHLDLELLSKLKNLLFLDVSYNYIKALNYPEKAIKSLKVINISFNFLNSFYFNKKSLPNLRTFNLSSNPIMDFDLSKKYLLNNSKLVTTIDLSGVEGWKYCNFLQKITYFWLTAASLEIICDLNKYNESCFKKYAALKFLPNKNQKSDEQFCIEDFEGIDPFVYFLIVLGSLITLVFLLRVVEYIEEYHRRQRFLVKDDIIKIHQAKLNRQLFEAFQETGNPGFGRLKTVCRIERGLNGSKKIRAQLCTIKSSPIVIKNSNTE